MIDLHTHTTASDGTLSPTELVQAAVQANLEALAITDHDTFSGYDEAVPHALGAGLDLVCGIEMSVKLRGRSVHLLGYFVDGGTPAGFRKWISTLLESREERNRRLVEALQAQGFKISMEEVRQRAASLAGRPHFAALLVEKGYAANLQHAFDAYLGEGSACYVPRDEPGFADAVHRITSAGGIASIAHPGRISRDSKAMESCLCEMRGLGLQAIEVWHSDHSPLEMQFYEALAARLSLGVTGGSDFHGANKPGITLGKGRDGRLNVPRSVLDRLRALANGR